MRKYRLVSKKGEGTFSEVLKAQNVKRGTYHAIKCMRNHFESIDQVNTLREIQALRRLSPHPHIITLEEVLYDQPTGRLALVFELMDQNLYEVIRGRRHYLSPQLIKIYIYQLLKGLEHMHRKGIFHRDIKPENILVNHNCDFEKGLKLADFGSCRGIYSKQPYTEYISTRWYRAPECLLTDGYYGAEMDLWGVGCVFFEITSLYPLFPGTNELDQINRVHQILGTPPEKVMQKFKQKGAAHLDFNYPSLKPTGIAKLIPHAPPDAVDLMQKLLAYDPDDRISAKEALRHNWFADLVKTEQNLKRRNRGSNNSRNKMNSSPAPKVKKSLSKTSLNQPAAPSGRRSKDPKPLKNTSTKTNKGGDNDSESKNDSMDNTKTTSSLPSIPTNQSGANATSRTNNDNNTTGRQPGDSPLPPIAGDSKTSGGSSVKPSNSNSNLRSSKDNSSSNSYGQYRRRKKDNSSSSTSNPYSSKNRSSKRDKHRSSKKYNQSPNPNGSSSNKKSYGAYGASAYKSSSSKHGHGSSKYNSSSSGSSASFSVLGHGHKGARRNGYGSRQPKGYKKRN